MTALVSSQPAFLLQSEHPPTTSGILLNARSVSAPLSSLQRPYHHTPPALASSSSSVSESHSRSHSSNIGEAAARKIRFAPLPDPRRDEFPSVFDHDESESDSPGQLPRHSSSPADLFPPPASPAHSAHSLQDQQSDDSTFRAKTKSRKWGSKLLRPLLHPLLPSSSSKSNDDALFPTSSRDGAKTNGDGPDEYKGGVALGRRMSANGITTSKETERSQGFHDGAPLTHVWSEGGGSNKGRKDGQRMLNGRVYGRRASSADRDRAERARKQDALEPEFVEWGYGGMGSVSNDHTRGRGGAGPDWAKVQSKGKTFGEPMDNDGEGDDGSGMGWVKKRRQQREREKREQEERERMQKDNGVPEIEVHPPAADENEETSRKCDADSETHHKDEEHHVYRAVSVPAPPPHHRHHSHSHHKGGETSGTVTPTSAPSMSRTNSAGSVPSDKQNDGLLNPARNEPSSGSGSSSSVSSLASQPSSESLQGDDEDDGTERESESEDDDAEEKSRITSKSAGVEKISRHKD